MDQQDYATQLQASREPRDVIARALHDLYPDGKTGRTDLVLAAYLREADLVIEELGKWGLVITYGDN